MSQGREQRRRRSPGDRDAATVEIGYAVCSAAFAAALVYGACAGPALLFALPGLLERLLLLGATALASALFTLRVVFVLLAFHKAGQPSQPGRTRPDS